LGSGFLESVYHKALIIELEEQEITFQSGFPLEVLYKGKPAGIFIADLIVENRLLLELKAVECILSVHELQIVNYLKATGLDLGLILNFGTRSLQIKIFAFRKPDFMIFICFMSSCWNFSHARC
jgi:GxxExxY protein